MDPLATIIKNATTTVTTQPTMISAIVYRNVSSSNLSQ